METMIVNMSSTNVGSNATYQCRDGPTDVYTTQCIPVLEYGTLTLIHWSVLSLMDQVNICSSLWHFAKLT